MILANGLLSGQNHREGNAGNTQVKAHTKHYQQLHHPKASMAQLTLLWGSHLKQNSFLVRLWGLVIATEHVYITPRAQVSALLGS